ncbi:unnamed protein product [Blepharisma stoltei]|uniref:Uncharacterized protein n=1 Tax=Blepharisma stoltei TaxID=1481888 RepID=A0AAU9KAL6_9CILI|nr:unnamed protein product [Blepharisma stoltei]
MDQLKCIIEGCQNHPVYICDCEENNMICIPHLGPHIIPDAFRHHILELYVKPYSRTVISVRSFLENCQEELLFARNTILEKSSFKVAKINEIIPESLKQINGDIKQVKKCLNNLNNLSDIPRNTEDEFYQALLLSGEEAINKIKSSTCKFSDYKSILCNLFTEVDIESIVERQVQEKFDMFLKLSLENANKACKEKVYDLETSLHKYIRTKVKDIEYNFSKKTTENIREIDKIKTTNASFKNKIDEIERKLAEMVKQHSKINTENKKEIDEIKAKISNFNSDLSQNISYIQNLNTTCNQKIDELEKRISEKVGIESDKIKSELNIFVLKGNFFTEINNLSLGISAINKKLDTYETKSQEIENKSKAEICKLNKIITEIEKEVKKKAKVHGERAAVNQTKSKLSSSIKQNSEIDMKKNTLEKSQTMPNLLFSSPREKTSLSSSQMALEINIAAKECSNSKHSVDYHLLECPESHCIDCLKNYINERNGLQRDFYCHHGKKFGNFEVKLIEMEAEKKKNLDLNKFSSPRAVNIAKKLEINTQNFDRNAQTPTVKQIPSYISSERSAIPTRASEKNMYSDYSVLESPRIDMRFQRTPSKKTIMSFKEE